MRVTKLLITGLLAFCICNMAVAQTENKEAVLKDLYALQKLYSNQQGLSFGIKYSYSNESKPDVILDSLSGEMLLVRNGYRYRVDKTETIHNDKYTIIMFEEDSLMHVSASRKSAVDPANPAALIDSSILNFPGTQYSIQLHGEIKEIILRFPPGLPYKSVKLFINIPSGLLTKTVMVLRTEFMTAVTEEELNLPGYDEYAIVETTFSAYRVSDKKEDAINESMFFIREGKEFLPTERYKNYKIFIGTPNL